MKIGNLSKAIAFASLWVYAAIVTPGVERFDQGGQIWVVTVIMSFVVIYLFDRGPRRE